MSGGEREKLEARRQFVGSFNNTMVKIWKERIALLGAVDSGTLYNSVVSLSTKTDGLITNINLELGFRTYGIFVDKGTGKETPRGNGGDIGRSKARVARPWFSKAYYSSVMRLNEFLADNLGQEFVATLPRILTSSR